MRRTWSIERVLVDCGAPVQVLLPRAGMTVAAIDVVLVTHFHADHTYMLPMFLGARAFAGELRPGLTIAGPPGTREYVLRLLTTGYGRHLVGLIQARLQPRWVVLQDGASEAVGGYTVRAIRGRAQHRAVTGIHRAARRRARSSVSVATRPSAPVCGEPSRRPTSWSANAQAGTAPPRAVTCGAASWNS